VHSVQEVCSWITDCPDVEGVTVSGGEPLQQAAELLNLLRKLRAKTQLSVLLFSGFSIEEIDRMGLMPELSSLLDVLICGRYEEDLSLKSGLIGSSNKSVCFFSDRYRAENLDVVPPGEVIISPDGDVLATGIDPVSLR
jgi:anaerobic ribonucleoside-triphosphate reductase activating protein